MPLAADLGFSFADAFAIAVVFVGIAVFAAIGALSHEHERAFSASIFYLGFGLIAAAGIHFMGIRWLDPFADSTFFEHATELAVVVALFATGLKLERELTFRGWRNVARLLLVAMPLTIGAIALFGSLVMGLSLGAAIALGACLAPTDPVLAGDIGVGPPGDEDEREPNFSITGEAGLNDGLAFPFLLLGIAIAEGDDLVEWALADVLYGIVAGLAIGALLGYGIAALTVRLRDRRAARTRARRLGGDRGGGGHLRRDGGRGRLRVPRRLRGRDRLPPLRAHARAQPRRARRRGDRRGRRGARAHPRARLLRHP